MPILAAPRAAAAKPAAAKAPAPRPWTGLDAPVQAKLDVGPAHDRFEAEADRVADSIAASPGGPAAPVAISPLPTPGAASRRALQREEERPIEAREKKADEKAKDLTGLLQTKRESKAPKEEPERVQTKPADGALQAKSDPKPGPLNRDEEPIEAKVQTKREAKSAKPEERVQKQPLAGSIQRDNVDDDTVLETSIQAKRDGALQRETVVVEAELESEQEEETAPQPVQREASSAAGFTAPAAVESGIAAMRGGGQPLAPDVRGFMEPRFGHDLSAVRIHDGARAGELAGAVHARAFTIGQDVFFGAGQYQPGTGTGRGLLAHELTHTIQQGGGSARAQPARIQRTPTAPSAGAASTVTPPGAPAAGAPAAGAGGATAAPVVFRHPLGDLQLGSTEKVIKMRQMPLPMLGGGGGAERAPKGTGSYAAPGISFATPWRYYGKRPRGSVTARQQWLTLMGSSDSDRARKITGMPNVNSSEITTPTGEKIAYLRPKSAVGDAQNFLLIGTPTQLAQSDDIRIPTWRDNGEGTLFHIDHVHEMQLGGTDGASNFWLLDQSSNTSAGNQISHQLEADFNALIAAAEAAAAPAPAAGAGGTPAAAAPAATPGTAASTGWFSQNAVTKPTWPQIRENRHSGNTPTTSGWHIEYLGSRNVEVAGSRATWTKADIEQGRHLDKLSALSSREIRERGLQYAVGTNVVRARFYARSSGGFFRTLRFSRDQTVLTGTAADSIAGGAAGTGSGVAGNSFYRGFAVPAGGIAMEPAPVGPDGLVKRALGNQNLSPDQKIATLTGTAFTASSGKIRNPAFSLDILWRPEFGFGGYVRGGTNELNEKFARLTILGASPVEVNESGLTPTGELFANGEIVATKALFPGLRIPIQMRGDSVFINFPIPTDKLNFGPVHVTEASIDMGFGANGIFLGGRAAVAVDGVGSGTITARVTPADTILEGTFNFNLSFLNPASATIRYSMANDTLDLTLTAGVREGVLPGVASGQVTGHFSREVVELSGTLNLAPPLAGSTVTVGYARATGITIAASNIPLPISSIPGITDATLSVRANYNPEDGQWRVSGQGSAQFNIPPATGNLTVAMDGPVFTLAGTAAFQQGPASGSLEVRATNAKLDEAGQPVEGQVGPFSITGRGSASLRFGILTGTAGIELTQDQRVIISGEIALPPSHEVFAKRSYERELLHVEPPEFPIWGVSLGGVGIGIFGFVDARLTFDAFVGPGTLENTAVHVTFELAKPEEAVVDGTAAFVVPAGAGFTLDIGGGLRARAAVAYVQGRIGLDARLGLLAEARADVNLHWTQAEGLSLAASAHAEARPQFEVGVNASVTAGVDLLVTDIEHTWGPWRQQLGSFGPEMAVGVTVPIAWSERTGLDFNTDNIEITRPEIDFAALMTDGFMQLV